MPKDDSRLSVERWRGQVDERLKNIEAFLGKIDGKLDEIKKSVHDHDIEIGNLDSKDKEHNTWIKGHEKEHENKEVAENRRKEISLKKFGILITFVTSLVSALIQYLMHLAGF